MAVTHSTASRDAATNAVVDQLDGAGSKLVFRKSPSSVGSPGTAVATLTFATPAFGASSSGTAHHTAIHDTSGAIAGAGANVAGVAAHHHTAAGVITGAGAAVAGSAARMRAHATQAVLAAGDSTVVGAAARLRAHTASGALPGKTAAVVGIALHNRLHATAGALAGTGASVVGVAHRTLEHATVASDRAGLDHRRAGAGGKGHARYGGRPCRRQRNAGGRGGAEPGLCLDSGAR